MQNILINNKGENFKMPKKYAAIMDVGSSKLTVLIGQQGVNGSFVIKGKGECE